VQQSKNSKLPSFQPVDSIPIVVGWWFLCGSLWVAGRLALRIKPDTPTYTAASTNQHDVLAAQLKASELAARQMIEY